MPPLSKRLKLQNQEPEKNVNDELQCYQREIRKIRGFSDDEVELSSECQGFKTEHDYTEDPEQQPGHDDSEAKKYIREQIRLSERRIHDRLDRIEQKINRLLESKTQPLEDDNEQALEEEHLVEWPEEQEELPLVDPQMEYRVFPINSEQTFDWFFERLRDEEYLNKLIKIRWKLTRNVSQKSFNISVKDFLRMHFDLKVVVIYSTSGYGAHGIRKKKFDANILTVYVFECFNKLQPGIHSFQEVNKAIVQFWGRAPDTLNKTTRREYK